MADNWRGLYSEGWQNEITPEAFAHPAKFSRALIRRIYDHCQEEGWIQPGDRVIDPFGGVALGALDAMRHGLDWTGCELEPRFVDLGNANIRLWLERYGPHFPTWGSARLVQGDSRRLLDVISRAGMAVSSPPYADGCAHTGGNDPRPEYVQGGEYYGVGITQAISSPPYSEARIGQESGQAQCGHHDAYGATPGQLGSMPAGDFQQAVSSPPFRHTEGGRKASGGSIDDSLMRRHSASNMNANGYGTTDGQLGSLKEEMDFWNAARTIVEQTYAALVPGAHACWVVKSFVKNKQIVDFPGQWQALCEAVGFTTLHYHRAWLVEDRGTQIDFMGNPITRTVERKSFFRRLAEKNGSPHIDYEVVLCMVKPLFAEAG